MKACLTVGRLVGVFNFLIESKTDVWLEFEILILAIIA